MCRNIAKYVDETKGFESGSGRIPCSLLRGKLANREHYYSLRIEDSPQFTVESFKLSHNYLNQGINYFCLLDSKVLRYYFK
jgi:hypothetical protein